MRPVSAIAKPFARRVHPSSSAAPGRGRAAGDALAAAASSPWRRVDGRAGEAAVAVRFVILSTADPAARCAKKCFTIVRGDARKFGLSRVCAGKRMCMTGRAKSPKNANADF